MISSSKGFADHRSWGSIAGEFPLPHLEQLLLPALGGLLSGGSGGTLAILAALGIL